jgi:hypothetical protein
MTTYNVTTTELAPGKVLAKCNGKQKTETFPLTIRRSRQHGYAAAALLMRIGVKIPATLTLDASKSPVRDDGKTMVLSVEVS